MARPRSEARRAAILSAATRVIAAEGMGASTAAIAREAGVSNGSLFVYFETKSALINGLYVALKTEMAAAATTGLAREAEPREQLLQMWTQWLGWAQAAPAKRRALAHLQVADDLTADSHAKAGAAFGAIAALLERVRANGAVQETPLEFLLPVVNAIADAAIDAALADPSRSDTRSRVAFDAIWRVLAGADQPAT